VETTYSREVLAEAFNEWMRRYTETPDKFHREWETVLEYIQDVMSESEPSYGDRCAVYLARLIEEGLEDETL
jgi:hypothetical protein